MKTQSKEGKIIEIEALMRKFDVDKKHYESFSHDIISAISHYKREQGMVIYCPKCGGDQFCFPLGESFIRCAHPECKNEVHKGEEKYRLKNSK